MADNRQIKYSATVDANPFAAGMARVSESLAGVQQRFGTTGSQFKTTAEGMSAQVGKVAESVRDSVTAMGGHFSGLLSAVGRTTAGFGLLVAAAAGIGASKAVKGAADMTESAMDLARVLGTSTNVAQQWRLALDDVGASQGDLEGAAKGMSRQLKENETDLQAMGLKTRDAAGSLRPMNDLVLEGIAVLNEHKAGADRALAAQTLFGRGVDASSKLLLVNNDTLNDAQKVMEELGLEVGTNATNAWTVHDAATDRARFSVMGLSNTVGKILMPVFSDLAAMFNAVMPAAIVVVKGALGGLTSVFHGLRNMVVIVWETINAMVISVAEPIRAVAEALYKAITGDFKGAGEALRGIGGVVSGAWSTAMDKMVDSSRQTLDRITAIFSNDAGAGTPEGGIGGSRTFKDPSPKKKKEAKESKEKADPSNMALYEEQLVQARYAATQLDAIHGLSKEQELAHWEAIRASAGLLARDKIAVEKKVAEAKLAILRDTAQQQQALDRIGLDNSRDALLARVDLDREATNQLLAQGQISKEAALAMEAEFEERRYTIRRAALQASAQQLDPARDPVKLAEVNAQIEALERQHQLTLAGIRGQVALQSTAELGAIWQDLTDRVSGLWDKGVAALMNGTFTWRGAMRAASAEVVGLFAGMVKKNVAAWFMGEQAKTGATAAGTAQRWIMESFAAAKSVALWALTAAKNIMSSAWEAMAGTYAAISRIPYVGPFLAPAMAATVFTGVAAMVGRVASAEGGFDIPAGMNPLTQLHEQEMVLPKEQANVIRDMADGGSAAGAPPIVIKGTSAGDFFIAHKSELIKLLKGANRNFEFQS